MAISEEVLSEDQSDGRRGHEHGRQQDQWMWILFTLEQIAAQFLCFSYLIKSTQQGTQPAVFYPEPHSTITSSSVRVIWNPSD